jgi:L-lactate dehydrogenase
MKVGVIGTGMVGSTGAYAMVMSGAANEIVLIDMNAARADAEAQDIAHAVPFARPTVVRSGGYDDLEGADVVVIGAGVAQKPGETRLQLLERNAAVFSEIIPQVLRPAPDAILLIATNPVDIMTEISRRISGLPGERVIGTGTILDTARYRSLLGEHLGISPRSVHSYVIGEHGDSEVLCWSEAAAGGVPIAEFASQTGKPLTDSARSAIDEGVRRAAYRIIDGKGATWFGIGAGIARIVLAIGSDERAVLTVSKVEDDVEGIGTVAVSLPRIVARQGVLDTLMPKISEEEHEALKRSALIIAEAITQFKLPSA